VADQKPNELPVWSFYALSHDNIKFAPLVEGTNFFVFISVKVESNDAKCLTNAPPAMIPSLQRVVNDFFLDLEKKTNPNMKTEEIKFSAPEEAKKAAEQLQKAGIPVKMNGEAKKEP
jgi:hypothetical protein